MSMISKAPRVLIEAAKEALNALADSTPDRRVKAYQRLAKSLDGVIPADTPEFATSCPGMLNPNIRNN